MQIIHSGTTYDCNVAVKCENDKYIKLYDANGAEIAAFHNISDFSQYEISGGNFVSPTECIMPIPLTSNSIGGRTITTNDWTLNEAGDAYYYDIESNFISANKTTCNVMLLFAQGTELDYTAEQTEGKISIITSAAPIDNIVIESVLVTRV